MSEMTTRVPLYDRLPEIYRIRDAEQSPPGRLRAFLAAVEKALGAVHESIEALYDDLFIDTCDDWVIPYLGDLLGTTHLRGDPWTLRADVADTIALRRRKGTLGALERLAADLTGWPGRAVELFPSLAWTQHLNHQRPDAGGSPPYASPTLTRFDVPRGGTPPIRDPAMLSLRGTPFDPFAYTPDVKRADDGSLHVNLPDLAVFLWRLSAYRLPLTQPLARGASDLGPPPPGSGLARFAVRFDLDPLDRPVRLFNTDRRPPAGLAGSVETLTAPDAVPGPIPAARLTSGSAAGNPEAYLSVDPFDDSASPPTGFDISEAGLQLHLPQAPFAGLAWTFRGDNLCAWETGLRRPLGDHEIVIDPDIGRLLLGVSVAAERDALFQGGANPEPRIFVGYTYGSVGPVGAHPISRPPIASPFDVPPIDFRPVSALDGTTLQAALTDLQNATAPVVVEIRDSLTYDLDPTTLSGSLTENGLTSLQLSQPLLIRAADEHRPILRLAAPLGFRPWKPGDASVANLLVRLEGLFLTHGSGFTPAGGPLIARAALAGLELVGCTLDPGGHRLRDGTRAPSTVSLALANGYGFADPADEDAFEPTPSVVLQRAIAGSLRLDDGYRLALDSCLVDAGQDVDDAPGNVFALTSANDPVAGWGPPLDVQNATFLGRVRVSEASGLGGLFVQRLEVWNNQRGCLKQCYFRGLGDRLPPNHACVSGTQARLVFTSTRSGDPGYGQLAPGTDVRIRTRGPDDESMGAFGFLHEASKWANLSIRLREFMPVGIRPLLLPIT